jgi:hypothetical protein
MAPRQTPEQDDADQAASNRDGDEEVVNAVERRAGRPEDDAQKTDPAEEHPQRDSNDDLAVENPPPEAS